MTAAQIILAIVGGATGAAVVNFLNDRFKHKEQRADKAEDARNQNFSERLEVIEKQNSAQTVAIRLLMLDKIISLGKRYIAAGQVTVDEKRRLRQMYDCYHNGLGGNGDADLIMSEVDELQIKG